MFQRVGSYKIRGPLNKFALMPEEQKRRGVVCSSAGNHAQGVALAAKIHGIRAVVCMAQNATRSKVEATKGYGAEVVLHGNIWDEANEKAKELVRSENLTYVHPFDDEQLIAGLVRCRRRRGSNRRWWTHLRRLDGRKELQPEDPRDRRGIVGWPGDEDECRGR
jgi:hypothetical protein